MRLYYILFILSLRLSLSYGLPIMGKQTLYDENEARVLVNLAAAAYGDQHQACLNKLVLIVFKINISFEDVNYINNLILLYASID